MRLLNILDLAPSYCFFVLSSDAYTHAKNIRLSVLVRAFVPTVFHSGMVHFGTGWHFCGASVSVLKDYATS